MFILFEEENSLYQCTNKIVDTNYVLHDIYLWTMDKTMLLLIC